MVTTKLQQKLLWRPLILTISIIISIIILLIILYILSLRGVKRGDLKIFDSIYAHRGLHKKGVPENSIEAFKLAAQKGYGIELDVHLLADGGLAVIHDSSILRTCGIDIDITSLKTEQLKSYPLESTKNVIPELKDVLKTVDGRVPLLIELKPDNDNQAKLSSTVYDAMQEYAGKFCIESFDPRCILWFRKNHSDIVCGQLVENFIKNKNDLSLPLRIILTLMMPNFLTKPSFISCRYEDLSMLSNKICIKFWGLKSFCWTIRDIRDFKDAKKNNSTPIFENIEP